MLKEKYYFLIILILITLTTSVFGNNGLEVTLASGRKACFDTTTTECLKYGFEHNDRIIMERWYGPKFSGQYIGRVGTIVGVTEIKGTNQKTLWFTFDDSPGFYFYMEERGSLHEQDFRLLSEVPKVIFILSWLSKNSIIGLLILGFLIELQIISARSLL